MSAEPFLYPRLAQLMLSKQEGGAEVFFEKLAAAFAHRGIEQQLMVEPVSSRLIRLEQSNLSCRAQKFGGLYEPVARYRLRRWLAEYQPDIVLSWMNRASRRLPSGPFVKVGRLGGYYKLKHYQKCDYLVVNTPDLERYVVESGWPADRVRVISNFSAAPNAEPAQGEALWAELELPKSQFLIVSLGRLHANKAFDVLLKAAVAVPRAHFVIAGEGPLEAELKSLRHKLGLDRRVSFLGWRNDAARLLRAADLCVFPSRKEPLGNVILEAWANRTAVIATKTAGPEWLIDTGLNGELVPVEDAQALAASINHHLDHPELRNRYADNGYQKFQEHFSPQGIIQQYLDFFEEVRRRPEGSRSSPAAD